MIGLSPTAYLGPCTSYGNSIRRLRRFSQTYQEVANSSILSHMRPEEVSPPCSSSNCSDDHESLGCHHCFPLGQKQRKHGETCWENGFPWEKAAKKKVESCKLNQKCQGAIGRLHGGLVGGEAGEAPATWVSATFHSECDHKKPSKIDRPTLTEIYGKGYMQVSSVGDP